MNNNWRQKLHLEPEKGWMNDPNGLSWFNGKYHVYFQYSPDDAEGGGDKCWGHWESSDLLSWDFTGIVLRPDIPEDRNGVYSGSGIVKDDTLHLFYTGNVKEDGDHDFTTSGRGANVIKVTTKDGHNMSRKKVLLRNSDYPDYCSCHVRDPKIWLKDGKYRMVLGARTLDDKGCVLYFSSSDLENWEYEEEMRAPEFGYMWECPDCFEIGGNTYLSISPQGLEHEEYRFQNVYSSGYFQPDKGIKTFAEWDYGFDFYAPQTFEAPDGRRIIIGWMGIGDIPYKNPTVPLGWQHCLTIPREVSIGDNGCLRQNPVKELEKLRIGSMPMQSGMKVQLPFDAELQCSGDISLDIGNYINMSYNGSVFSLRFIDDTVGYGRNERRVRLDKLERLRIIADTSSIEIYLNGGAAVMSTRFYPADIETILISDDVKGTVYKLRGLEVNTNGK